MPDRPAALPPTASVAEPAGGARLHAPSALRNVDAIADLLADMAPASGSALELASGTGQHVAAFAARLPGLHWQPTDIEAARLHSIDAWAGDSGRPNIAPAVELDASVPGWGAAWRGQSLILLINLLHLIPMRDVHTLIGEAASALAPGGRFVIYGPFMRAGKLTSDGDAAFHASLSARDSRIGYKDDGAIAGLLREAGLTMVAVRPMPANNLAMLSEKPAI